MYIILLYLCTVYLYALCFFVMSCDSVIKSNNKKKGFELFIVITYADEGEDTMYLLKVLNTMCPYSH